MGRPAEHVTISFFRYTGRSRFWAMRQMAEMQAPLGRVPGVLFHKLLGTGSGTGYGFLPDLGTYALLIGWADAASEARFHREGALHRAFVARASEIYTLQLTPVSSHGAWSGVQPFKTVRSSAEGPLVVLTRATIRPSFVPAFWRRVGGVARALEAHRENLLFTKGIGELPWVVQATFSVWRSEEAMLRFAYGKEGPHRAAVERTRKAKGFREELFARFRVRATSGTYNGVDPLHGTVVSS